MRDVLDGRIRVKRCPDESGEGLQSIQICRYDLVQGVRNAKIAARLFSQSPQQRAERARERDAFYRSGQVYALLEELWPRRQLPYLEDNPRIRCRTRIWKYRTRELRQRFYSVADALELLESRQA